MRNRGREVGTLTMNPALIDIRAVAMVLARLLIPDC